MFGIFHGISLIGRSGLEAGDPPMGVASGLFNPTDAFAALRSTMVPARDGAGRKLRDSRYLAGLSAKTADGIALVCSGIVVFEYGEADNPSAWEVVCLGIEWSAYDALFPHHVKAYKDQLGE